MLGVFISQACHIVNFQLDSNEKLFDEIRPFVLKEVSICYL